MIRVLALLVLAAAAAHAEPLRVCATTPDLASITTGVGGPDVTIVTFARGTEDPHFVEAKPSFVRDLSRCQLLVLNGLEVEIGWLPALLDQARNAAVRPGGPGYLDAATAITPAEVPSGTVDRSMGDVHPYGNPHYLTDPMNGLRVAGAVRDRLARLVPEQAAAFGTRYDAFRTAVGTKLLGETLVQKYAEWEKLVQLADYDKLDAFLAGAGDAGALGGWLGAMRPYRGTKAVDDHPLWPYFARRFGLVVVGHMEPKPGIPPTTRHLAELIELMQAQDVRLILAASYYDPRHARFLAEHTQAKVVALANQVGSRPGVDDYLAVTDWNVSHVVDALAGRG
ncbi:MAG: zinc ABC transporter substrate-binding protein [bacterium]|nr:zinc ABC transporter substrate-binding protein [bacterium]